MSKPKMTPDRARRIAAWLRQMGCAKDGATIQEGDDVAERLDTWADREDERAALKTCLDETNEALKAAGFATVCPTPGPDGDEGVSPADQVGAMAARISERETSCDLRDRFLRQIADELGVEQARKLDILEAIGAIKTRVKDLEAIDQVWSSEAMRARNALENHGASGTNLKLSVLVEQLYEKRIAPAEARVADLQAFRSAAVELLDAHDFTRVLEQAAKATDGGTPRPVKVIEVDTSKPEDCRFCDYEQGLCIADAPDGEDRGRPCVQGSNLHVEGREAPPWCPARGRFIVQAKDGEGPK